jgi:2-dehydro-3-deoxygluconokinase
MKPKVVTFGEIMLRISPSSIGDRINTTNTYRIEPGGSEANVAVALSSLGMDTRFLTSLPDNPLASKVINSLHQFGVDTSEIIRRKGRLGSYWTENGIGPRNSFVIYDRTDTSFSNIEADDFEWNRITSDCKWIHFSGISPAVSSGVYDLLDRMIDTIDIPYSVDLNYRSKLWDWVDKNPDQITDKMSALCRGAKLIAGNESDFQNVLQIKPTKRDQENIYDEITEIVFNKYPKVKYVAISQRGSISASTNNWSGLLYTKQNNVTKKYSSSSYLIDSVEDRVGTGDSFVAGIIYGLLSLPGESYKQVIEFAAALSALNHSTRGDFSSFSEEDVQEVLRGSGKGRIIR